MTEEVLTNTQIRYAEECLEADKSLPKLHLSAEQMRAQVQRIHEEAVKERENNVDAKKSVFSREERTFLNDFHKKSYEAARKEIEDMSKNPLSREEMEAQIRRNHLQSTRNKNNTDL